MENSGPSRGWGAAVANIKYKKQAFFLCPQFTSFLKIKQISLCLAVILLVTSRKYKTVNWTVKMVVNRASTEMNSQRFCDIELTRKENNT